MPSAPAANEQQVPRRLAISADGRAAILIVAAVVLFFADILLLGRGPFERDLSTLHFPQKRLVSEAMRSGEFPYWNPRFAGGQPLAANPQYEIFYPGQLPILLSDYYLGFRLHLVLHFLVAALGMYVFLRSLSCGRAAALSGALAFGLGGPMMSLLRVPPFLAAFAWTPWILFFARRYVSSGRKADLLGAALVGGLQGTVGEPVMLLQTWAIVVLYGAWRAWNDREGGRPALVRPLLRAAVVPLAAALVAAVQLLPAADLARDSVRGRGLTFEQVSRWSMPLARIGECAFPRVHAALRSADGEIASMKLYPNGDPFIKELNVGVLTLLVAIAGIVTRRRGWAWVSGGLLLFAILAAGSHTPLLRILYDIGVARALRYPEKLALGMTFVLVTWSALTADALFAGDRGVRRAVIVLAGLWLGVAALAALGSSSAIPDAAAILRPGEILESPRVYWLKLVVLGAILFALLRQLGSAKRRPAVVALLVTVTAAQLLAMRPSIVPTVPKEFFDRPRALSSLARAGKPFRLLHRADWEWADDSPLALQYFENTRTYSWIARNGAFPEIPGGWGFDLAMEDDFDTTSLIPADDLRQAFAAIRRARSAAAERSLLAMSNVDYIARFRDRAAALREAGTDLRRVEPVEFVRVGDSERVYFADRMERVTGWEDFVARLLRGDDLGRAALVDGLEPFAPAPGRVKASSYGWNVIRADVESSGRGFLVISATRHKYWRAEIDGTRVEIAPTNVGYMGIEVPAGSHRVVLRYSNPLVGAGAVISVTALVMLVALAVFRRRRKAE